MILTVHIIWKLRNNLLASFQFKNVASGTFIFYFQKFGITSNSY